MRSTLALFAMLAVPVAVSAQDPGGSQGDMIGTFKVEPYRALRAGELHSAAFLSEMRAMPYGKVLGPVSAATVQAKQSAEMSMPGSTIGILPPAGGAYQKGDTVVLGLVITAPKGWGEMIIPTGLARVVAVTPRQTEAVVVAIYGPIRGGQVTLPMTPMPKIGEAQPVKADGPTGTTLFGRDAGDLQQIGSEVFVDLGRASGIRLGDFIEIRRHAGPRANSADTVAETLAVGQVVSVGEKSSTVRLFRIADPAIAAGSPVLRVATLSN